MTAAPRTIATAVTTTSASRFCTFRVGADCFALESEGVAEVLRAGRLTAVPLAPPDVLGLVHLRGRIVPIIDLARRLGIVSSGGAAATHLVIRLQDDWYGLLVDEMLDVIDIPRDRIEHPTSAAIDVGGEALIGVFADEDRLVHLLDPQRMIQSLGRQRPQPLAKNGASHGSAR